MSDPKGNTTAPAETATATQELWKKANSTHEADSLAPLMHDGSDAEKNTATATHHRKNWFKQLSRSTKGNEKNDKEETEKKKSIADSGPLIFAFDPKSGKEVLQRNPHWPNEDSWKREKEVEGKWAFGSMMGQQGVDFGGSVG